MNIWLLKTSCKLDIESMSCELNICILSRMSASPSSSLVSSRIRLSLVFRLACIWNNHLLITTIIVVKKSEKYHTQYAFQVPKSCLYRHNWFSSYLIYLFKDIGMLSIWYAFLYLNLKLTKTKKILWKLILLDLNDWRVYNCISFLWNIIIE